MSTRYVHVEAAADAARAALAAKANPQSKPAYVDLQRGTVDLDALSAYTGHKPGVSYADDDDDPGWAN